MRTKFIHFSLMTLALVACIPKKSQTESDVLASSSAQALPIVGTFQATELFTFYEEAGQRKAVHAKEEELKKGLWRVRIDLDSQGNGLIQGLLKCRGPVGTNSRPATIRDEQPLNALFGLLGLTFLINRTVQEVSCAGSPEGAVASLLPVARTRTFFGTDVEGVAKNLGVFGEGKSMKAVDDECRRLRGHRFVTIKDSTACVGYTDASAKNIRFLIVPTGEIYAVRVNMKRD